MDETTKDSAAALAIIDRIEAAIRDREPGSIDVARQFIADAMSDDAGVMFALQGMKSMLVWMQGNHDQRVATNSVWSTINNAISDDERDILNALRCQLYMDADLARDWIRSAAIVQDLEIPPAINSLVDTISKMPRLEP